MKGKDGLSARNLHAGRAAPAAAGRRLAYFVAALQEKFL
jgi:hypothetical protein